MEEYDHDGRWHATNYYGPTGEADDTAQLTAERDRLQREVQNLVGSIAAGVPAETVAPAINERQRDIAKLETKLRQPRPVQPKIDELRAALEQRAAEWRETLRAEPKVARMLLRRLMGPLILWDAAVPTSECDEWVASLTPALLEGLGPNVHLLRPQRVMPFGGRPHLPGLRKFRGVAA